MEKDEVEVKEAVGAKAVDAEVPIKETTEEHGHRRRLDLSKEYGIVLHQRETKAEREARLLPLREAMREEASAARERETQERSAAVGPKEPEAMPE